jgi:ferredoxin
MWAHNNDHKAAYYKLKLVGQLIQKLLENKGHQAVLPFVNDEYREEQPAYLAMVPPLSHKYLAIASGIGWLGWNQLVLTPEYGAPVALTTVVTSAALEPDDPLEDAGWCQNCRLCVPSCPVNFLSMDNEETVTLSGQTYRRSKARSIMRCLTCCGGATGVNNPADEWSTWSPVALDLPGPDDDQAFEQRVLEYAKDPEHIRLKWLLDFFAGKGVNSWDEFDYTFLIEEWFTCGNCMLICWPQMADRKENYRLLRTSGKVTQNDTYRRVSVL